MFALVMDNTEYYQGFVLNTEDDINQFLDAFGLSPTETNQLIEVHQARPEVHEKAAMERFIASLTVDFPTSEIMSAAARSIQDEVYDHHEFIRTNPDRKLLDWTDAEYRLFRALEYARYGELITHGFTTVEDFISTANQVLNRRKSRAGKSLEHHLAAIFDGNEISYRAQAVTEGNKKPDFIFPSQEAYHNPDFPNDRIISLAAKTTCKDRWRQVINEADRLRGKAKYLCTLQQGISAAQMDEMQAEQVVLVVPKPYILTFPRDRQDRIWTVGKFVSYVREKEYL
ncbi:type II restriction endonuclease [Oscillibacter sp.]|uniref:type II restriction endonuclease n=1 Tax=Oscillibacter sp. TaxID=1945593 RepID=UPI0028A1DC1F|nr:type II restriction endonuclease [Oscillibacter sp.]